MSSIFRVDLEEYKRQNRSIKIVTKSLMDVQRDIILSRRQMVQIHHFCSNRNVYLNVKVSPYIQT